MLPNGWKKSKIGETCSLLSGQDFPPNLYGNEEKGLPYITGASNFAGNHMILNRWTEHPKNIAKKGDILLVCKGSGFGITAIADFEKAHIARQVMALQKLNGVDRDFLYQVISMNVRNIKQKGCGLIPGIDRKTVLNIEYLLPPLEEQKKIAATLSVWDSAIEKMEKLIDAKEDQKKSLIWKLIESNDNRKIKLGKVVVDKNKWRKSKLSDVASGFDYGMNAAAKEYDGKNKYIRITDIDDVSHKFNSIDLVSPNAELEDKYRVNEGDILFARTGASTGKSYLYDKNDGVLYFAGFLIRVHVLKDDPFFIYVQTLSSKYQNWLKKMSMRSGQPGVNAEEYKNLPILVPTLPEQNAITEVLFATDKELSLLKQQLENYKKQKQGLMQKLLTGQWRVK